ncbi:MAG: hypothetical protein M1818_006248 [Claussenomyces sp. TS43310]|nr:MAG: hypothetical protein M1818_006248 [Claussenomyces sp. TS43310]
MAPSRLDLAEGTETVYLVAMDEVRFLAFGQNGLTSISTRNLNGCSAVMIVSKQGAILGHFPPRPSSYSQDLEAGDNHIRAKIREVAALYKSNQQYFPSGHNWVVCALFKGEVALPDQQKIMEDTLASLGLSSSLRTYEASKRNSKNWFPGQGTVFVDGGGPVPDVYIEDKRVSQRSANPSAIESYYYVKDKQYFLCDETRKHVLQSHKPKNIWVFNEKGWTDSNGKSWRLWDGKDIIYE